jgi:hypothetical protein
LSPNQIKNNKTNRKSKMLTKKKRWFGIDVGEELSRIRNSFVGTVQTSYSVKKTGDSVEFIDRYVDGYGNPYGVEGYNEREEKILTKIEQRTLDELCRIVELTVNSYIDKKELNNEPVNPGDTVDFGDYIIKMHLDVGLVYVKYKNLFK